MSHPHQFESRHLGNDAAAVSQMLEVIGAASLDQLIDETIPDSIRMHGAKIRVGTPSIPLIRQRSPKAA